LRFRSRCLTLLLSANERGKNDQFIVAQGLNDLGQVEKIVGRDGSRAVTADKSVCVVLSETVSNLEGITMKSGGAEEMRYLKVRWIHDYLDEPLLIYSEIDADGFEVRKVEVLRDGRMHFADEGYSEGGCELSTEPLPSNEEISSDKQFELKEISRDDFNKIWLRKG